MFASTLHEQSDQPQQRFDSLWDTSLSLSPLTKNHEQLELHPQPQPPQQKSEEVQDSQLLQEHHIEEHRQLLVCQAAEGSATANSAAIMLSALLWSCSDEQALHLQQQQEQNHHHYGNKRSQVHRRQQHQTEDKHYHSYCPAPNACSGPGKDSYALQASQRPASKSTHTCSWLHDIPPVESSEGSVAETEADAEWSLYTELAQLSIYDEVDLRDLDKLMHLCDGMA